MGDSANITPYRRLRRNEFVRAQEFNALAADVAEASAGAGLAVRPEQVSAFAGGGKRLVRIVGKAQPASDEPWSYSWVDVVERDTGTVQDRALSPGGTAGTGSYFPAWEKSGNPHVPIDGTAIVELEEGVAGSYYTFTWGDGPHWFEITGGAGPAYAWEEKYHVTGMTWADLVDPYLGIARTGSTTQNPLREIHGVTGLASGTIVEAWRGGGSGAPQVVIGRDTLGNGVDVHEKHSLYIIRATAASYTLTFEGQTTSALAYNHNAAALETALEALSNLTAVTVTGLGTEGAPFVVEYLDDFDAHEPSDLVADQALMKGDQQWVFDCLYGGNVTFNSVTLTGGFGAVTLDSDQTAWDLSTYVVVRVSGMTTDRTVHGILARAGGTIVHVFNVSTSYGLTFKHLSGSASAANQIALPNENDYGLQAGAWTTFAYDSTSALWRLAVPNGYFEEHTPATLTADVNDYVPGPNTALVYRLSSNASRTITGIAGGWGGRPAWLVNIGGQNIVLDSSGAGSVSYNRINSGGNAHTLHPSKSALLVYDLTSQVWRVVTPVEATSSGSGLLSTTTQSIGGAKTFATRIVSIGAGGTIPIRLYADGGAASIDIFNPSNGAGLRFYRTTSGYVEYATNYDLGIFYVLATGAAGVPVDVGYAVGVAGGGVLVGGTAVTGGLTFQGGLYISGTATLTITVGQDVTGGTINQLLYTDPSGDLRSAPVGPGPLTYLAAISGV